MKKNLRSIKFVQMKTIDDFKHAMADSGLDFPINNDIDVLMDPVRLGDKVIPNRVCSLPCEGFDGLPDGSPSELSIRKYKRIAGGGAGLIWYESTAFSEDGLSNPLQLMIRPSNVNAFKVMIDETNKEALKKFGHKPYHVLQLTHSGRSAKDFNWVPQPLTVYENPYLDDNSRIDRSEKTITIASDDKIEEIIQGFIDGAILAQQAGFDAVDIKICHRYFLHELLSAFTRPGKYGGSLENRTRALFEIIDGIRKHCGDSLDIGVRLNAYDSIPYPYGWGMKKEEGAMELDLSEPIELCRLLVKKGVRLINLSASMPHKSVEENEEESEVDISLYENYCNLWKASGKIKEAVPEAIIIASGLSVVEQFGGNTAAGGISAGWYDIGGFGRQFLAYPDFAADLFKKKAMEHKKCCVLCNKCFDLMLIGQCQAGCVIRDREVYTDLYKKKVVPKL